MFYWWFKSLVYAQMRAKRLSPAPSDLTTKVDQLTQVRVCVPKLDIVFSLHVLFWFTHLYNGDLGHCRTWSPADSLWNLAACTQTQFPVLVCFTWGFFVFLCVVSLHVPCMRTQQLVYIWRGLSIFNQGEKDYFSFRVCSCVFVDLCMTVLCSIHFESAWLANLGTHLTL